MPMLLAAGLLAWIAVAVLVVSLCAMAARGDGRDIRRSPRPRRAGSGPMLTLLR